MGKRERERERERERAGLEVIKLELILTLKIKRNDWLLADTCPQATNHCALFRVALLCLSSLWLFLTMPRVCLQFVLGLFSDHTRLLFLVLLLFLLTSGLK